MKGRQRREEEGPTRPVDTALTYRSAAPPRPATPGPRRPADRSRSRRPPKAGLRGGGTLGRGSQQPQTHGTSGPRPRQNPPPAGSSWRQSQEREAAALRPQSRHRPAPSRARAPGPVRAPGRAGGPQARGAALPPERGARRVGLLPPSSAWRARGSSLEVAGHAARCCGRRALR